MRNILIWVIFLVAVCLFSAEAFDLLRVEPGKRFQAFTMVKEFEMERPYLRWCLPIKEEFLGLPWQDIVAHEDDYMSGHQVLRYRTQ